MFIGHYGVAFACKRVAPRASLGALVAAVSLLDLIWPVFVPTGREIVRVQPGNNPLMRLDFVSYPYSHSLLFVIFWALLFGGLYFWRTRYRTGAVVIAAGVVSHWALDLIVHRPDLPLYPGGAGLGLGLWNSVAATVLLEGAMFACGVWLYVAGTRPENRTGRWALWSMIALLLVAYAGNLTGPPPPGATAVAAAALAAWLFPLWAWWADRNRRLVPGKGLTPHVSRYRERESPTSTER